MSSACQPHRGGDAVGLPPQLAGGARHALRVARSQPAEYGQYELSSSGGARLGRVRAACSSISRGDLLLVVDDELDAGVAEAELELGALELRVERHDDRAELRDREER